jgi:hypothetical protein
MATSSVHFGPAWAPSATQTWNAVIGGEVRQPSVIPAPHERAISSEHGSRDEAGAFEVGVGDSVFGVGTDDEPFAVPPDTGG